MDIDDSRRNDAVEQIKQFCARGTEFFADVQPQELPNEYLKDSRLISNRAEILQFLPKGGICAKVGTQTGAFAKVIWSTLRPEALHIYDIDFTPFDPSGLEDALASKKVHIHKGDSSMLLAAAQVCFFDFIYIDGDHSYDGVKKDLVQAVKKIKPSGYIVAMIILCSHRWKISSMKFPKRSMNCAWNTTSRSSFLGFTRGDITMWQFGGKAIQYKAIS